MALTVYTTSWCGPCKRLKSQLTREGIAYSEVDIERHPDAAEFVMSVNNGNQVVPTVVADCHTMTNPSVLEVKRHLQGAC
ncbi:mycoredoxin [Planotetraspora sp. A-T 1434]|uniref:mycoredoxin n=1 Tax=Planotetraspora sp. A-T 1434 TaxID=2979219 RepID=UPI0021C0FB53|nr:mycoredoxin [Planotetraspora sp. A-T 1434]MCT9932541.1 mycoredoxin [Planotetraspora sp. A-T 1434]